MKEILKIISAPAPHWVGDGFPVRSLFSYDRHSKALSPFLLLDYAGPAEFAPAVQPRGVGAHPHRGFETVTIVYQGEVDHRDSTGAGGHIGPGDVQWMTAASGILHEEFHSEAFTRRGGMLEMVQLWVNLPVKDKMADPGYQTLPAAEIPKMALNDGAGTVRVIAGELQGYRGPARTFTPMDVWDIRLSQGNGTSFELPEGRTLALAVLRGTVRVNDSKIAREAQVVVFSRVGTRVAVEADRDATDATLLLLSGEPIDEPIVGQGPFVMNSQAEIAKAIADFNGGRLGRLSA
jgi:redox-sensitive bicupin YhaK (pirin superfamily)